MYPSRFRYEAPRSIDETIALLNDGAGEAKVLAGGQSLVPLLKLRFAAPELVVDINALPGLDYHRVDPDGTIRVGALCRHADLERSAILGSRQPTMAAASHVIADPIVRNRGTLVGSLCHADPQGDWASVVTALGGYVVAQGSTGRRHIRITQFVTGPFQNALAYDEVAVEAVIPAPKGSVAGGYLKLERRVGYFATAGTAVALELSGSVVTRAGIALTGVGGSTIDATDAAQALVGAPLAADRIRHAADLAAQAAQPRTDHRGSATYKRHIVHTFVERILTRVQQSTTEGGRHDQPAAAAAGPPAASGPQAHRYSPAATRPTAGPARCSSTARQSRAAPCSRCRPTGTRSPRSRGWPGRAGSTRSRRGSRTSTACSAGSARRA